MLLAQGVQYLLALIDDLRKSLNHTVCRAAKPDLILSFNKATTLMLRCRE
jgi:hypothetical protein